MIFASDVAREIYHALPTDTQVDYGRLEEYLAGSGKILRVESIMTNLKELEVVIRVSEELHDRSVSGSANGL